MATELFSRVPRERVKAMAPDIMIPAYGEVENDPAPCLKLLEKRLREYADAYVQALLFPDRSTCPSVPLWLWVALLSPAAAVTFLVRGVAVLMAVLQAKAKV